MDASVDVDATVSPGRKRLGPAGRRPRPRSWAAPLGHEEVAVRHSPGLDDLVGGRPADQELT
jgi:hypothetical protein